MPTTDPEQPHAERAAPGVPSFASLRDARRRSPLDLLVPPEPVPAEPVPVDLVPPAAGEPVAVAAAPTAEPEPPRGPAPRPAQYADLIPAGVRLARWSVAVPVRVLRWLLGR